MRRGSGSQLQGLVVVLTRAREDVSGDRRAFAALGARVVALPCIERRPPRSFRTLDRALERLSGYDAVLFTSAAAVDVVVRRLAVLRRSPRALQAVPVAAVGTETARHLERRGLRPLVARGAGGAALAAELLRGDVAGKRFLFPRAAGGREELPRLLRRAGARISVVTAYVTGAAAPPSASTLARVQRAHAICFASPSAVKSLASTIGRPRLRELVSGLVVASIGPTTSEALRAYGIEPHVEAAPSTMDGLRRALVRSSWIGCNPRPR